jgi:hypothetical protein
VSGAGWRAWSRRSCSWPSRFSSCPSRANYFTDYQIRSAHRFDDMNFRGVAASVIASDASDRTPAVYLSDDLGEDKAVQWEFHLLARQRADLWDRTRYVAVARADETDVPSGALLVLHANNPHVSDLVRPAAWSVVDIVQDLSGGPAATILRKNPITSRAATTGQISSRPSSPRQETRHTR